MYFVRLFFPEIFIFFSRYMTGDFSTFGLGDVATRRFVGPPYDRMHFVWLIFPEILIFFLRV